MARLRLFLTVESRPTSRRFLTCPTTWLLNIPAGFCGAVLKTGSSAQAAFIVCNQDGPFVLIKGGRELECTQK